MLDISKSESFMSWYKNTMKLLFAVPEKQYDYIIDLFSYVQRLKKTMTNLKYKIMQVVIKICVFLWLKHYY